MSRARKTFSKETVELVTSLWNSGVSVPEICNAAGFSRDTLDYHRSSGAFQHLQKRKQGVNNGRRSKPDDEKKQMLFGMGLREIERRKSEVRSKWTPSDEYHRRTGVRLKESRAANYNPGTDETRSHHPRHGRATNKMNRADNNFKNYGLS